MIDDCRGCWHCEYYLPHEEHHRVALARELTAAAGVPLRDRYGFAAQDRHVLFAVDAVAQHPLDQDAADAIGLANAIGDVQLCAGYDRPISQEQELAVVAALRPLVEQRRDAAVRGMG